MKLYFVRHQAAGVLHDTPFAAPPSGTELALLLARCEASHGKTHPKTGAAYWAKVICVDTDKPVDHPERSRTHGGVNGESCAEADAKSAGYCPLREGHLVPNRGAGQPEAASAKVEVVVSAVGHVENP
jgi:hypothetical protein